MNKQIDSNCDTTQENIFINKQVLSTSISWLYWLAVKLLFGR